MTLALLCGPSGTGKTSIIGYATKRKGFRVLRNFTTRRLRPAEKEREHLSPSELNKLDRNKKTAFVNDVLGAKYAVLLSDLETAFISRKPYIFDIAPKYLPRLRGKFQLVIFLMPKDIAQIRIQLRRAGRLQRMTTFLSEYRENAQLWMRWKNDRRAFLVVNKYGDFGATCRAVSRAITKRSVR
jgi:guanylate kinase